MAGVALFDFGLIAYPLYRTSQHITTTTKEEIETSDRWLQFWLTFSAVKVIEGFGADGVPGFQLAKALLLMSMYSLEHAVLVSAVLPRACHSFLSSADRMKEWWAQTAAPRVEKTVQSSGYLSAIFAYFRGAGKRSEE